MTVETTMDLRPPRRQRMLKVLRWIVGLIVLAVISSSPGST